VALTTGQATVGQFDDAPAVAAELRPWLEKVHCYTSERLEAAFPASWQAEVSVRFKDGRVIEKSEAAFRGAPQDRATRDQLVDKAAALLTPAAAQALDESVQAVELDAPLAGQVAVPQKDSV
jgi:2-methylcitrate dehydratase PrpD